MNVIGLLLDRNKSIASLVRAGFRHLNGNGLNSNFWIENWTGKGDLMELFLRIFELATLKYGPVSRFDEWIDGAWH